MGLLVVSAFVIGILVTGEYGGRPETSHTSHGGSGGSRTGSTKPRNASGAIPTGWVTLPYDDVEISVTGNWVPDDYPCDGEENPGTIYLGPVEDTSSCPPAGPYVWLDNGSFTVTKAYSIRSLNGLTSYFSSQEPDQLNVRSVGATVSASGPLAHQILGTLRPSPRYFVFSTSGPHAAPETWRRVTYAGLSLAVPTSWPIDNNTLWDECRGVDEPFAPSDQVVFDRGTVNIAGISCSSSNTYPVVEMPSDGVAIVEGPYSAAEENGGTFGKCLSINALSVCPSTSPGSLYDILTAVVHIPREPSVEIDLGLGGFGEVARTILYSIEKA